MATSNTLRNQLLFGAVVGAGLALGLGGFVRVDRGAAVSAPGPVTVAATVATPIAAPGEPACEGDDDAVTDDAGAGAGVGAVRVRPAGEGGLFVMSGAPLPPDSAPEAFDAAPTPTIAVDWEAVDWDAGYADPAWFPTGE